MVSVLECMEATDWTVCKIELFSEMPNIEPYEIELMQLLNEYEIELNSEIPWPQPDLVT